MTITPYGRYWAVYDVVTCWSVSVSIKMARKKWCAA